MFTAISYIDKSCLKFSKNRFANILPFLSENCGYDEPNKSPCVPAKLKIKITKI